MNPEPTDRKLNPYVIMLFGMVLSVERAFRGCVVGHRECIEKREDKDSPRTEPT